MLDDIFGWIQTRCSGIRCRDLVYGGSTWLIFLQHDPELVNLCGCQWYRHLRRPSYFRLGNHRNRGSCSKVGRTLPRQIQLA